MIRALVLYEAEPDADRYRQHVDDYASKVAAAEFRHGPIFGAPFGEPAYRYCAEFEWPDRAAFEEATGSDAWGASGKDAMSMGIPFKVLFAELG